MINGWSPLCHKASSTRFNTQAELLSARSSLPSPTEVNWREHLAPTVGLDKTWSHHPHLRLRIPRDEKHEAKTVGIWRKWGPCLATIYGGHEGPLGGKRRILTWARADSRGSQGRARMVASWSSSRPRAPLRGNAIESRLPYGKNQGLSNNYGGARTSQWEVTQDQRGTVEELALIGSTSCSGTFPGFIIEGWPQVVLTTNYGRACVTPSHHTQDHLFRWCRRSWKSSKGVQGSNDHLWGVWCNSM